MKAKITKYILQGIMLLIFAACGGASDEVPSLLTPPDVVAPTITNLTPPVDGTYIYNQNIAFTVTFSESVAVLGTPVLELTIDGSMVNIPYIGGSGTQTLSFNRNIDFERVDADGIDFNGINLSGGSITDNANNVADLTIASANYAGVLVDSVRPVFTSVIVNTGETYTQNTGAVINSVVTGADEMIVSTASDCSVGTWVAYNSALAHTLTANTVNENYVSFRTTAGSRTNCYDITISHDNLAPGSAVIVQAGDASSSQTDSASWAAVVDNGPAGILNYEYAVSTTTSEANIITGGGWIDIALALSHQITTGVTLLNGTDYYTLIKAVDNAGNESITASSAWQLDSAVITSVTPPGNNTYNAAADLDFIVNFDQSVTVTGTPRISIDMGGSTVYANYVSGSPGTALTFRYTVQAGDNDADGIAHSSPIDLNSGSIVDTANSNNAVLTFIPVDTSGVLVSTIIVPTKLVFVNQPSNTITNVNINPAITVELRDAADNLATTATDNIALIFGTDPSSGSALLSGTLTVAAVAGVATFNDINIDQIFTGYTLTASAAGLTSDTSASFDITPVIDTVVTSFIEPVDGTYAEAGVLLFQVNYNEAVTVSGTPRLQLNIGGITRYATYQTGSGGTGLEFQYTIAAGENDGDGIAVSNTNIDLNGGSIIAVSDSVTASLDFGTFLESTASVLVDTSGAITPPNKVTGVVTAPTTSNSEVSITWSIPGDNGTAIVSYSLQYREQGVSTWSNLSPAPTTNSATIGGLSAGTTYEIRVAANNGILGPYSDISNAEVFDLTGLSLALWLDFSDSSALFTDTGCGANVSIDGDTVACVSDKSGFGRNFIQATAGSRPTYRTNAINGLGGLEFDGAGDFLEDADGENYINGYQAFEFFVVIKADTIGHDKGVLDTKDPDGSDDGITLRYDASGASGGCTNCMKGGVQRGDGTHVQSESTTNSQSTNAQIVGASWEDGTKFNIYVNGSLSQSFDNGTMTGTIGLATKVLIGKGPKDAGANGWDGKIVEIVFLNTSTTTTDRTTITNYLKSKWGIP